MRNITAVECDTCFPFGFFSTYAFRVSFKNVIISFYAAEWLSWFMHIQCDHDCHIAQLTMNVYINALFFKKKYLFRTRVRYRGKMFFIYFGKFNMVTLSGIMLPSLCYLSFLLNTWVSQHNKCSSHWILTWSQRNTTSTNQNTQAVTKHR